MFAVDSLFNFQSKVISPSSSKNLIAGLVVGSLIGLGLRGWSDWMALNAFYTDIGSSLGYIAY